MIKRKLITVLLLLASASGYAQTTFEEMKADIGRMGGVYYAYPNPTKAQAQAPKGYEAFYISHYGRHGSRYLISDKDYSSVLDLMQKADKANALTTLGKDVMRRLTAVCKNTDGHSGDLSALGVKQHRGIAERMFANFPTAFSGAPAISARSTTSVRCVLSMAAFCDRLKELNSKISFTMESSDRYMRYLNYHSEQSNQFTGENGPWREEYRKFEERHVKGERLAKTLFTSDEYIEKNINPMDLAWKFYWVAVDMQDIEEPVSFMDLFTSEELFNIWQTFNYRFYVCDGNYAGSNHMLLDNAKPLLRNIIESAEAVMNADGNGATLRFGHDGNLIPLTGLLQFEGCYNSVMEPERFYTAFSDWKIAPMAGNVQIVFYRNKKNHGDVIVKFMLNEHDTTIPVKTDIAPFYHWRDVKTFCMDILND